MSKPSIWSARAKGGRSARASTYQGRTMNFPYWRKCESNEAARVILSLSMTAKLRASQRGVGLVSVTLDDRAR